MQSRLEFKKLRETSSHLVVQEDPQQQTNQQTGWTIGYQHPSCRGQIGSTEQAEGTDPANPPNIPKKATSGNNLNNEPTRETQGISQENNQQQKQHQGQQPQGTTPSRTSKDRASSKQSTKAAARKDQSKQTRHNKAADSNIAAAWCCEASLQQIIHKQSKGTDSLEQTIARQACRTEPRTMGTSSHGLATEAI